MITTFELHGENTSKTTSPSTSEISPETIEAACSHLPWFMSISLSSRPRCFGCGGRLLPKVVFIQANCAICDRCERINWDDFRPYWLALQSRAGPLELTRTRGIVFWTPPVTLRDMDAYLRWLELRQIERDSTDRLDAIERSA